ncbi:uncharacterized protein LOC136091948 [Hydra vulgaris]|uniref:Uncharacterized protein LOC136091948 n=1 Tax=Hydra vulgaris TaxID=6087 RepID=A0ABM4DMG1_HYDVU
MGNCKKWSTQGSVLGPLLFIIFINNLTQGLNNKAKLYADDTKVIAKIDKNDKNSHNNSLQDDLDYLFEWSTKWLLSFNSDKCKIMHIGHDNPKNKYTLKCNIKELGTSRKNLKETSIERDLGVYIINDLKWEHHIEFIVNKANSKLGLIKHSFNYIDKNTMKLLYISLAHWFFDEVQ